MRLKTGFYILVCAVFMPLFASCLGDNEDDTSIILLDDAQILSFGLSHDSIPALTNVKFTIDQVNGLIFNHDSMDYQTVIDQPVVVTYANAVGISNVFYISEEKDTVWLASSDSLDISKVFQLKVMSLLGQDSIAPKNYDLHVNIHQVDPDSMQYHQILSNESILNAANSKAIVYEGNCYIFATKSPPAISGTSSVVEAYKSTDLKTWTDVKMTGLPTNATLESVQSFWDGSSEFLCASLTTSFDKIELYVAYEDATNGFIWNPVNTTYDIKAVLGFLKASPGQESGLALIVEKDGKNIFAFTHDFLTWEDDQEVDGEFPLLSGFSTIQAAFRNVPRLVVAGVSAVADSLVNTVWATEDGLYWAKLSQMAFPTKGANTFSYNNALYLINGKTGEAYNKSVYCSIDGGIHWSKQEDKCLPPANYVWRENASVLVDDAGKYFYIIGGKNTESLTDIWEGFVNKRTFKIIN